ncbi:solute carrier family 23 protein [Pseudooceanicola algae]|uniref:solute carrier family 23 protein n=1 Tax=Pseudooceanicola algae TaxID=1537215 RepID=UPI0018AD207A|nr:solute carrier family 23 protein [Pseudooceanicola algae]
MSVASIAVLQQVLLTLMLLIYAVITAQQIGLDPAGTVRYTSTCIFGFGASTLLQGIRSRLSPGMLMVAIPSPVAFGTYVAIIAAWGPGAAVASVIIANIIILFIAPQLPKLRGYFPPEVAGVAVFMIGVTIIPDGVLHSLAPDEQGLASIPAAIAAVVTLGVIVAASIWGGTKLRVMSLIVGAGMGTIVAVLLGAVNHGVMASLPDLPIFAIPRPTTEVAWPLIVPSAIMAYTIIELVHAMDQVASALTMDKLTDKKWVRADMSVTSRSVTANAIGNIICGGLGTLSGATSTANIGLSHACGVMSRYVGIGTGLAMMAMAFVPAVALIITLTPEPVVGGVLLYTAAFMLIAGMELILSRMMNSKRSFTVGFSIVVGFTVVNLPYLVENLPQWSQAIVGSGLTFAVVTAIALNALFRIGTSRTVSVTLDRDRPLSHQASELLEHWGGEWGARQDVVMRCGIAVGEALEVLTDTGLVEGDVLLTLRFDEVNLRSTLTYQGTAPQIDAATQIDLEALMADEDDSLLDAKLSEMSSNLIRRLADRVSVSDKAGKASLLLEFNH